MKKQAKKRGRPPKKKVVKLKGKNKPPTREIYVDEKDWDGVGRAIPDWFGL